MFEIKGKYTSAKIMIDDVEEECINQITKMINHPAFTNPVAVMVDCHAGKSSCVGFTMPMSEKIVPAVIGVDIGCSVMSINIGNTLPMSLEQIDHKIRQKVPFGFNIHSKSVINMERDFPYHDVNTLSHNFTLAYNKKFNTNLQPVKYDYNWFTSKVNQIGANYSRIVKSIGSLGGGNHFIEIGQDNINGDYWITIHTGSRNFGKCVCDYWQDMASKVIRNKKQEVFRERVEEIRQKYSGMEIKAKIKEAREELGLNDKVSSDLNYLEGEHAHGYLYDMIFAQKYAEVNRAYIAKTILNILGVEEKDRIETVHNFIDFRDFIIRKGAVRSYIGERFVLPFNMRDGILICEGKSNSEWNYSANHGSGRVLSRSKAKKTLNLDEFKKQMDGIYSTSVVAATLDEAPDAYKDSAVIEAAIEPTAKILFKIKPILNMKDNGKKGR